VPSATLALPYPRHVSGQRVGGCLGMALAWVKPGRIGRGSGVYLDEGVYWTLAGSLLTAYGFAGTLTLFYQAIVTS
jgi:hypothetical protein